MQKTIEFLFELMRMPSVMGKERSANRSIHKKMQNYYDDADNPRSLILDAHTDVAPPSKVQINPCNPGIINGTIFSCGACDDTGQIAIIYLLPRTLFALKLRSYVDFVVEEENGGSGTLSMVRLRAKADATLVLESREYFLFENNRSIIREEKYEIFY
ncbi:M20/M25/M40 family metallo-hydrolase [candidate division KSB1 bacterium]|nr:M20/M25/M40 family metallo-hydrolase [candidate division KSB1 bacterium]